jgi:molybdate transport system substrate-binding protein
MQRRIWLAGLAAFALGAVATASPMGAHAERVVVFAAASLKNALDAIADKWHEASGNRATISYAASSTLAKQIENGAPAGLFISADTDWMDYLQKRDLIDAKSRVDLLGNRLVLIAPTDHAPEVTIAPGFPLAKLLGDGRLAMADPAAVPAGMYGKAALTKLGVWPTVADHLAVAENVRAALLLVARDDAPLGIVYRTDAAVEPAVKIIATFPSDSHPPIVYPMALTRMAQPDSAAFAAYLRGPAAGALFAAHGFTVLDRAR